MYTDPSGEFFWLIPAAVGFVTGYISHGIKTGDWGWRAVGAGFVGAGVAVMAFYSGGATSAASIAQGFASVSTGHGVTVALGFSARYAATAALSSIMPSISIPVSSNFSVTVSLGICFSPSGLAGGASISLTYFKGKNSYTLGFGGGTNYVAWGISASFNNGGFGIGYHRSYYGDAIGPDGNPNPQVVGGLTISSNKFSFRIENDFLAFQGHDRWRSNAVELGFFGGDVVVGTSLYNNFRKEGDPVIYEEYSHKNGQFGRWVDGQTYNSPFYLGIRSGNSISRIGYSHKSFQHAFQNVFVHKSGFAGIAPFGHANYFMDYNSFYKGSYFSYGYYNPFSLWGR